AAHRLTKLCEPERLAEQVKAVRGQGHGPNARGTLPAGNGNWRSGSVRAELHSRLAGTQLQPEPPRARNRRRDHFPKLRARFRRLFEEEDQLVCSGEIEIEHGGPVRRIDRTPESTVNQAAGTNWVTDTRTDTRI